MDTLLKNFILAPFELLYHISPTTELKLMFFLRQGYRLNIKNPKTYNEKIQWIKLYDKNPWMPKCCDKYTVREYVHKMNCENILNNLLWDGFDPADIPWKELPPKFVIKVTHGSTFNIIVTDKNKLNIEATCRTLNKWLRAKFITCYGEWFYGKIPPRIIIEEFLDDGGEEGLMDYKVFCFNGVAKIIDVHTGRYSNHRRNVYNPNWEIYPDVYFKYNHIEREIPKPEVLSELIKYAEQLSSTFNHARVDFYIVKNRIYFGEITFTNGAGFDHIEPRTFDYEMGAWLELPTEKRPN